MMPAKIIKIKERVSGIPFFMMNGMFVKDIVTPDKIEQQSPIMTLMFMFSKPDFSSSAKKKHMPTNTPNTVK